MRISLRPKDSGYHEYIQARCHLKRFLIRLNGELQTACVTADDEAGMIVRFKVGADGEFEFDRDRACLVDEVVHGKVEIELINEDTL